MSVDDLLFAVIIGGMALSIAYMRAQYLVRRSYRIAARESEMRLRELFGTQPRAQHPLKGSAKPLSGGPVPHAAPNAALHSSLPVRVRFVYPSGLLAIASRECNFRLSLPVPRSSQPRVQASSQDLRDADL